MKRLFLGIALGFLILLLVNCGNSISQSQNTVTPTCNFHASPYYSQTMGSPAITPHICSVPSFTSDDVQHYVETHPFVTHVSVSQGKVTASKIDFLSYGQAVGMLHDYTVYLASNIPNDRPVCFVTLTGTFVAIGEAAGAAPSHQAHEIFDAQTGNLLILGG
ncbi:MAG TPA: hypothetical protein VKT25_01555 [Ktedonobacteraceae bacterium]|nr:hypothetical protein [Ktedonobacteraceae bacterium]